MGEVCCASCNKVIWHIRAHASGKCSKCGARISYCSSCGVEIPAGGDWFGKKVLAEFGENLKEEENGN